ncbi:MAG: hypothetical protein LBL66_04190 [Clostridiales bacterium]|jgi:hypothetical protein|nr:hypothetical protein [Clostridiales bacterium]
MKSTRKVTVAIWAAVFAVLLGAGGVVWAAWSANTSVGGNSVGTKNATLTSIGGTAFAVTDLIPYDQPEGVTGAKFAAKAYTVTVGEDAETVKLTVVNLANSDSLALYYKVTDTALTVAPSDTDGWTLLANGDLAGAGNITATATVYVNVILVSANPADGGKVATFDLNLAAVVE